MFPPKAEGKNTELGSRNFSVRKNIRDHREIDFTLTSLYTPDMDATELGIQIFFVILLPGFFFGRGFSLTSGIKGVGSDFAALCYASLWGVILVSLLGSDPEQIAKINANPIFGGVALALAGFVVGFILGLPVGWFRAKIRF